MLKRYTIAFKDTMGQVVVQYCDGLLMSAKIEMEIAAEQLDWFWNWLPRREAELLAVKHAKIKVTQVVANIGFTDFWDSYGYKMGKKDKAMELWKNLNESDRSNCLLKIPRYKRWLASRQVEMLYPQTFLSQRRWENEF